MRYLAKARLDVIIAQAKKWQQLSSSIKPEDIPGVLDTLLYDLEKLKKDMEE